MYLVHLPPAKCSDQMWATYVVLDGGCFLLGSPATACSLMEASLQSGDPVRLNPCERASLKALSVWTHLWQPHSCCFCLPLWFPWPRRDCTQSAQYTPADTWNHKDGRCSVFNKPAAAQFYSLISCGHHSILFQTNAFKCLTSKRNHRFSFIQVLVQSFAQKQI